MVCKIATLLRPQRVQATLIFTCNAACLTDRWRIIFSEDLREGVCIHQDNRLNNVPNPSRVQKYISMRMIYLNATFKLLTIYDFQDLMEKVNFRYLFEYCENDIIIYRNYLFQAMLQIELMRSHTHTHTHTYVCRDIACVLWYF